MYTYQNINFEEECIDLLRKVKVFDVPVHYLNGYGRCSHIEGEIFLDIPFLLNNVFGDNETDSDRKVLTVLVTLCHELGHYKHWKENNSEYTYLMDMRSSYPKGHSLRKQYNVALEEKADALGLDLAKEYSDIAFGDDYFATVFTNLRRLYSKESHPLN